MPPVTTLGFQRDPQVHAPRVNLLGSSADELLSGVEVSHLRWGELPPEVVSEFLRLRRQWADGAAR